METTTLNSTTSNTTLDITKEDQTKSTINNKPESNMEKDIKSLTADLFPWVYEFRQIFEIIYRDFNMHKLIELMKYYTRNISISAEKCYSEPSWAVCLKESISNTLAVFLNIYCMLSENNGRCIYLNYMSDLLAIYINIELKASDKTKEDPLNISSRLISCLNVYLEHSTEYLLDTLFKVQFMCASYSEILNPLITKIIKTIPVHPKSNIMFLRYFLIYRLWVEINTSLNSYKIAVIADSTLGPPPNFPIMLRGILPIFPKDKPNPVKSLLLDEFNTRECCRIFLKKWKEIYFREESNKNIYQEYSKEVKDITTSFSLCDKEKDVELASKNIDNVYNNVNSRLFDNGNSSKLISLQNSFGSVTTLNNKDLKNSDNNIVDNISTNNIISRSRFATDVFKKISLSQRKYKRRNKIILVDLTSDVEVEKCLNKRSNNPSWLKLAKRQMEFSSMKTSMKMKKIQKKITLKDNDTVNQGGLSDRDRDNLVSKNLESAFVKEKQDLSKNSYFEKMIDNQSISGIELDNNNMNKNIESEVCTILKPSINNASDIVDILINNEVLEQRQIFSESEKNSEISSGEYINNSTIGFSVMNGDDSDVQAEVEIDNSVDVGDDIKTSSCCFENKIYNTEENIITITKNTSIHDNEIKCISKENINNQYINLSSEYGQKIFNDNKSSEKLIENQDRSKSLSYPISSIIFQKDLQPLKNSHDSNVIIKNINKDICEIEDINNDIKISSDKRNILHNNELSTEENIDGLSLLASVSQHVPHLNVESNIRCDQIKIKDYAILKSASSNQIIDNETDTNDSSNIISQLCENPTSKLIKRIVDVYPEDNVYPKKIERCVNLISTNNGNTTNVENMCSVNVPYICQGSMNYETSDTLSNIIIPLENNIQFSKETTNVIHNGETVVLLQKSPNSNLYTINKAVENARNHNDNDGNKIIEKSWVAPPLSENGSSYEIANSLEHNFIQEKHSIGGEKSIKIEPKEDTKLNIEEKELYTKKESLRSNSMSTLQATLQDIDSANLTTTNESNDKHKSSSKSISACRQSIKQEFSTLPANRIPTNYTVQGCGEIHSHSREAIESQHSLHITASHPTALSKQTICRNCKSVSCGLLINTTTSLHTCVNSNNSCGRTHCSCLSCTYDIVTHCQRCINPGTDSHVSCIESNSYFLPTHSSVQGSTVQEHDRTKNETVIGKLYDENILCGVEKDHLQNNTLETIDMKCDASRLSNTNFNSKLPFKKRLKAHAIMSMHFKEEQIKTEKLDNYPAVPMMSIAALEPLETIQKHKEQIVKPVFTLSPNRKDDIHGNYHSTSNQIRRNYCKDIHDTTSHVSNAIAKRKEIVDSDITAIKRFTLKTMPTDVPYKRERRMESPPTRRRRMESSPMRRTRMESSPTRRTRIESSPTRRTRMESSPTRRTRMKSPPTRRKRMESRPTRRKSERKLPKLSSSHIIPKLDCE